MKFVFKQGEKVEIYLSNGKNISGTVVLVSDEYVQVREGKPNREQSLNVYINYLHISHVYA